MNTTKQQNQEVMETISLNGLQHLKDMVGFDRDSTIINNICKYICTFPENEQQALLDLKVSSSQTIRSVLQLIVPNISILDDRYLVESILNRRPCNITCKNDIPEYNYDLTRLTRITKSERKGMREHLINNLLLLETYTRKDRKHILDAPYCGTSLRKLINIMLIFSIEFKTPKYKKKFTDYGDQWYRCSALYAKSGNIRTDNRLTILPRTTQGLGIGLSYMAESVTALATAFSYYLMYKSGKNVYHTAKATFAQTQTSDVLESIRSYIYEIVAFLTVIHSWYVGKIDSQQAMLMFLGLGGWVVGKKLLLSTAMSILKPVPVHSTERETQSFSPTTLAQNIIAVLVMMGLGIGTNTDAKTIYSAIKGLGATILTVKTVENVFIAIISYLPEILQYMICSHVPAFALYVKMSSDVPFRRFIEITHQLQSYSEVDLFYHSHNFATFGRQYHYLRYLFRAHENIHTGLHLVIPGIIDWYDAMALRAYNLGLLQGDRKMPFVIWVSGDPGIGKSNMVKELSKKVLAHMFEKEPGFLHVLQESDMDRYVYSHNTSNKYFDGYNNQPIFVLNDYLQFAQENEEQWLIRFADTNECQLEVSSTDNTDLGIKGEVRFTSRVIIVTSNVSHLHNSTTITNLDAFNRRRDIVLDMTWKKENGFKVPINFDNFDYSWATMRLMPALAYSSECYLPFNNLDEVGHYMDDRLSEFIIRSGKLDLRYAPPSEKHSIKEMIYTMENFDAKWDRMIAIAYNRVSKFLEEEYFGLKLKFLLPLIIGGTSATYMLYKSWVPSLASKFAQSLSGDSATQRIKKNLKPIVRTTMGDRQNDSELALKLMNNVVRISTTIKDPNGRLMKQTMWGWSSGGSLIITPKHLWKRGERSVEDGDMVTIEKNGINFDIQLYNKNLYVREDEDIAILNVLGSMPSFKSIDSLILGSDHMIDDAGEDCVILIPVLTNDKINPVVVPTKAYLEDAPYTDEFGYIYEGRNIWQYSHRMIKGDCGSILLLKTPQGMKICGIHVAGDNFSGNAEVVTKNVIEHAKNHFMAKETQGFSTDAEYIDDEYFDAESDLEGNFYFLGKVLKPPYQKGDTVIVKSPLYEVLQPHMTEPAVLSPTDKRMNEVISPILLSVSKYGKTIRPFDKQLLDRSFDIVKSLYDPIRSHKLKVFDVNDAINSKHTPNLEKLDVTTSAGYPWNTQGKTKKSLISTDENGNHTIKQELMQVINRNEKLLANKTMFPYTLVTTLKDERVSLNKVAIGKTRTFMNFPVEYTILMRRYFDDFIDKETRYAMEIGTTVGVNIYSSKWHDLFQDLHQFDYTTDGDFKAFDGSIRPEFFKLYSQLVNSMYQDEYSIHRDMLCTGCCFAPIFVLDKVYMKLQGNPSGSRLTTSFNSFVNRMYVIMSILNKLPDHLRNRKFFKENMKIFAHGDDHIIGFNQVIMDCWDALELKRFMQSHGIDYTSSTKDSELGPHRELYKCYYLKSYFVYNKTIGKYQAGLDKDVIQEMVSWQRDLSIQSTEMIVQTAQRYAYFWGREYFNEISNKLDQAIRQRHLSIQLIDFDSLEHYYLFNGQMDFEYV